MIDVANVVFGPLAGPECRRALGRGRTILFRSLAALPALAALLITGWLVWLLEQAQPGFLPGPILRGGSTAWGMIAVGLALVLGPAVTAGTLAGDKDRGTLAMLIISRVSPREIVTGRLAGRLTLLAGIVFAGAPAVGWLSGLLSLRLTTLLALILLPLAVAYGGVGAALAASAVARRARDALMAVYFLDIVLLLAPGYGAALAPPFVGTLLNALNPFQVIGGIVAEGDLGNLVPAVASIGFWTALGIAGTACAAWQLAPVYLRQIDGATVRRVSRPETLPPIADRPMFWKELYIEQARKFKGVVRLLNGLAIVALLGVSVTLAAALAWAYWVDANALWASWAVTSLAGWLAASSRYVCWLIQWSVGLRAAVTIASERERHTWDMLLTTPLEGGEIVWAKIWGSLYALRGLIAAALLAWTLGLASGAIGVGEYSTLLAKVIVVGAFMAAVGVWASLVASTATRAMTYTLVGWLAAVFVIGFLALFFWMLVLAAASIAWYVSIGLGQADPSRMTPWLLSSMAAFDPLRLAFYALGAVLIGWHCRRNFDRLAGRAWLRRVPQTPVLEPVAVR